MAVVRIILTIIFILVCIALTIIVLMQEGKQQGLGSIGGLAQSDTFWSKNKGRSMEGVLVKGTAALVVAYLLISVIMNIGSFY